ncbi:WXG100 family type VII secretion target [Gordonia sp. Z-3]|uniref:WXG100 family type VII secretion target n=1 Tax=Gordonia aquimaris TaxID=2984863 RepID=A0A9X3I3P7_9ACTN|nr:MULTISPECIES: WXG100 family type VII secretion target [Gordonia]MAU82003.1 hypothetical protein [Gordonia sp. (in: high G+C Gram-positive bacteria)]MCX2962669.1 WXG100 family type VII secretion target [Gordonia aquimaris]MED5799813.1 WXG100 family type VII secretion target [Gordonia sp. Z-3]
MGETFRAEPAEIAGFGNFVGENVADYERIMGLLREAGTTNDFSGLMSALTDPVVTLQLATQSRWVDMGETLGSIASGLAKSAWIFHGAEAENAEIFRQHVRSVERGPGENGFDIDVDPANSRRKIVVDPYPGAVNTGSPTPIDVSAPPHSEPDIRGLIEETSGWLAEIDATVEQYGHWSPIRQAIKPISGNWEELRRIGEVYSKAGTAVGTIGNDVAAQTARIDGSWDGKAAHAFADYSRNATDYMEWEAALGRMLREGFEKAAAEFENAVGAALRVIINEFEKVITVRGTSGVVKALAKSIPLLGTAAQLGDLAKALIAIGQEVLPLIEEVRRGVEAFQEFIEFAQDPVGFAKEKGQDAVNEKLAPYKEELERGRHRVQVLRDVDTLMGVDDLRDRPQAPYEPETGGDAREGIA